MPPLAPWKHRAQLALYAAAVQTDVQGYQGWDALAWDELRRFFRTSAQPRKRRWRWYDALRRGNRIDALPVWEAAREVEAAPSRDVALAALHAEEREAVLLILGEQGASPSDQTATS